jgi:hypothetical protein
LGVVIIAFFAKILRVRASRIFSLESFVLGFLIRFVLVLINERYQLFDQKIAGDKSVDLYFKYIVGDGQFFYLLKDQFAVQVLINTPFFAIFGASLLTAIIVNSFISSLTAPLMGLILRQPFGERVALRATMLASIYPAAVNFSLFGLRDPLIYFFMAMFVVTTLGAVAGYSQRLYGVAAIASCMLLLVLRPELFYVVIIFVLSALLPSLTKLISKEQRTVERIAMIAVACLVLLALTTGMALLSLKIAATQIGAATINPLAIAGDKAEERFDRAESQGIGGGSHIASEDQYKNMPIHLRVIVQTAGLILLPFPWQIQGVAQMLAFGDSLFLFAIMFLAIIVAFKKRRGSPLVAALLVSYFIALVGMGLIVSNAGNGFRMRLGVVPVLLTAGAFCRSIPVITVRSGDK